MEPMILVVVLAMVAMLFFSTRTNKKREQEIVDFRQSLSLGDEVMTGSGLIGVVVEKDLKNGTIVVNSEGTRTRWLQDAITKRPVINTAPARGNKAEVIEEDKSADKKGASSKSEPKATPKAVVAEKATRKGKKSEESKPEEESVLDEPKANAKKAPKKAKTTKKAKGEEDLEKEMTEEADILTDEDRQDFGENDGLDSDDSQDNK